MRLIAATALVGLLLPTFGCQRETKPTAAESATSPAAAARKPVVYTTFYPTTYFTQRIADGLCEVVNPCPPDADPMFWMPPEDVLARYQKADLIVLNGASYEKWVPKVTLPPTRVVDTTHALADELIVFKHAFTHSHGPTGKHTHKGIDGHTWLDPLNALEQARAIEAALSKRFPQHKEQFAAGLKALADDLHALDARFREVTRLLDGQVLLTSHPAYNYVARRYGWQVHNYALDPEHLPDEQTLAKIADDARQSHARLMLWESAPAKEIVDKLATLGLTCVVFSPCETPPEPPEDDYLKVMHANLDRLAAAPKQLGAASQPG